MNIKQLRLFHEVMISGKISLAAEQLNVSQPAASKMLNNFEHLIGYSLFARLNGRLQPTPEAILLHRETISVLQGVTRLQDSFSKAREGQIGKLNIASIFAPAHSLLPMLASLHLNKHPQMQMSLQVLSSLAICEGVAAGQFEFGLVDKNYKPQGYDTVEFKLPCYCAIHSDNPLASHSVVSANIIDDTDWITLSPISDIYQALKNSYTSIGKPFNPRIEVNGSLNALAFVAQQCGVTLIDAINMQHVSQFEPRKNILFKPFLPDIYEPLLLISTNKQPLSVAAIKLREAIIKHLTALCKPV